MFDLVLSPMSFVTGCGCSDRRKHYRY